MKYELLGWLGKVTITWDNRTFLFSSQYNGLVKVVQLMGTDYLNPHLKKMIAPLLKRAEAGQDTEGR